MGTRIISTKHLKYLGIVPDGRLYFGDYVKRTIIKSEKRTPALTRIILNIGGPSSNKRAVLCSVVQSILLYGATIWHHVVKFKTYSIILSRTQRKLLLRVASAYQTASTISLEVILGIIPIDFMNQEKL